MFFDFPNKNQNLANDEKMVPTQKSHVFVNLDNV